MQKQDVGKVPDDEASPPTQIVATRVYARAPLAQPIGIECMGEEHADADEDEESCHNLCHSFPPCVAMPERACFRNSR